MLTFWVNTKDDLYKEFIVNTLEAIGGGIQFKKVDYVEGEMYYPSEGESVLAMGASVVKCMQDEGILAKNRTVPSLRGKVMPYEETGGIWMVSYNPGLSRIDAKVTPQIKWDITLLERYHRQGNLDPQIGEYEWVTDFSELIEYIKWKHEEEGTKVGIACDLETMGLYPWYPEKDIVSISFSVEEGHAQVLYCLEDLTDEVIEQIDWLLNSDTVLMRGANFKFDLIWIKEKWGVDCTNFSMDTLIVGSLLNENRSNSLTNHTKEYAPTLGGYDDTMNTKFDKGKMESIPKDDLLTYAGGDTDACLRTSNKQKDELRNKKKVQRFYGKLLHPASRAFEDIEYQGMVVDLDEMNKVGAEVDEVITKCKKDIINMMPRRLRLKHKNKENILTPAVIAEFLFTSYGLGLQPKMTTATGKASTAKDHLLMFGDVPEAKQFTDLYSELKAAEKTKQTYITGFMQHLRPDNRFHPTYALYSGNVFGSDSAKDEAGTVTGRLSAKNPAIQTLPKHTKWAKRLRDCYPAPPDHDFFQIDFSEGELRVAACIAQEDSMINAYLNGLSLHAKTGATLSGVSIDKFMSYKETNPKVFGKNRQGAKAANFGLLYGLQWEGYQEYAHTAFGLELTKIEAKEHRELFFETYPELLYWHERTKGYAHQNGFVISPLGRVRHLPLVHSNNWGVRSKAERQAINSPVQSTLSDLCLLVMAKVKERFTMKEVWIAGMTHDSVYGYIPKKYTMERLSEMKEIAENLPLEKDFGWVPDVPFLLDAEIGDKYSTLEEVIL